MIELKVVMKELQQLVATLASSSEPIKKGGKNQAYVCYFWSWSWTGCSYHTSSTWTKPKNDHVKTETIADRKRGSNYRCAWWLGEDDRKISINLIKKLLTNDVWAPPTMHLTHHAHLTFTGQKTYQLWTQEHRKTTSLTHMCKKYPCSYSKNLCRSCYLISKPHLPTKKSYSQSQASYHSKPEP